MCVCVLGGVGRVSVRVCVWVIFIHSTRESEPVSQHTIDVNFSLQHGNFHLSKTLVVHAGLAKS